MIRLPISFNLDCDCKSVYVSGDSKIRWTGHTLPTAVRLKSHDHTT